ncbi:MAG TPA: tryptophan--tRNA ligase [Saprospiraceae bacterium]|nr:tryptophan--tRNA ligase [Saprospiraceae bacterium]
MSTENLHIRKQVLSGIQPTGNLHLGRYFGAIRNWVELQEKYDCIYSVVNYHAMTMPFEPMKLREQTWDVVFDLIAVGVNPDNLFVQSMVPEHTELAWIFNCVSSYGELQRMTQFKDKSQQIAESSKDAFISTGLFTYPVLQAADILIYRADYVPVGKDQDQHLELSRNIAARFNNIVGKDYFVLPEPLYTEIPKVMSTADPSKKMSASLGPKHFINVFSEPDTIRKQIKTAVTDSGETPSGQLSAGVENLFSLLAAAGAKDLSNEMRVDAMAGRLQYGKLKDVVGEQIINHTNSFREKRNEIGLQKDNYQQQVSAASERIRKQAQETIKEVKELIGLMNVTSF